MLFVIALISPFIGVLADRYPPRRLYACGLSGMAIFYLAMSAVSAPWQILALYGSLAPVALTFSMVIVANALVSRWFVRRLGLALGLSSFGLGMAGVLLPPIIASLLPAVGWRAIWRGAALLTGLLVMPLVTWIVSDRPTARHGFDYVNGNQQCAPRQAAAKGRPQLTWREVASRRNFWILVGIYLPILLLFGGCAQNTGPYMAAHGFGQQYAGLVLSVMSMSHLAATLVLGLLSDRFGNRLPLAGSPSSTP